MSSLFPGLFLLALLNAPLAQAAVVFTEGAQRLYSQQAGNDLDYFSLKAGGVVSGDGWGAWGEAERFFPENYDDATNFEIAALKTLGPITLTGAYGQSDDFRFKPSHMYLIEMQVPFYEIGLVPYFGHSREEYDAVLQNVFKYYKVGAVKSFGTGHSFLVQYQYIDNENENRTIDKVGSQVAATWSYAADGSMTQLGAQFSCTGAKVSCDRNATRDEYFEGNLTWRWMSEDTWGLRAQVTYVYQKSFIIRETSSEIGRSSWILRIGPQFTF